VVTGQPLKIRRAIEVGHVFKLGTKYSEKMNASYLAEDGSRHPCVMGCYGIGINRIFASAIELGHDADGIGFAIESALGTMFTHGVPLKIPPFDGSPRQRAGAGRVRPVPAQPAPRLSRWMAFPRFARRFCCAMPRCTAGWTAPCTWRRCRALINQLLCKSGWPNRPTLRGPWFTSPVEPRDTVPVPSGPAVGVPGDPVELLLLMEIPPYLMLAPPDQVESGLLQ
jgi:hypothetical protein